MGCDIHIFAEVKNKEGKWEKVGSVFPSEYAFKGGLTDEPYEGRNYTLFALLANVRNSYGINPIKECPSEIPEDASEEIRENYYSWGYDAHSATFYTLKELKDFNWNFKHTVTAMIPESQRLRLKSGKYPEIWFKYTNQDGWENVTWEQPFESSFPSEVIPKLESLGSDENVRVIMWFDN